MRELTFNNNKFLSTKNSDQSGIGYMTWVAFDVIYFLKLCGDTPFMPAFIALCFQINDVGTM